MSSYHGLCTFPHGGSFSGLLWFALAAATICSTYSISSCRFVVLQYTSNQNFEDFFAPTTTTNNEDGNNNNEKTQDVGLGLFTWLLPSYYVDGDDDTVTRAIEGNWQEGSCQGYKQLQLEQILDSKFEAVRILGVFSVLLSWSIFLFGLLLSCLSLAHWQRYALTASCVLVAILNGCTLLMIETGPCITTGQDSFCELDQGGLVAIAAVILWVCCALLSFFFLEPPTTMSTPEKLALKRRQKKKIQAMNQMRQENKVDWNTPTKTPRDKRRSRSKSTSRSPQTPSTVHTSRSLPSPRSSDGNNLSPRDEPQQQQKQQRKSRHGSRSTAAPATTTTSPTNHTWLTKSRQSQQQPLQEEVSPPVLVKPQRPSKRGANNKSLELRYLPQGAGSLKESSYSQQQQYSSNKTSQNKKSKQAASAAVTFDDEKKNDGSDEYDCIPLEQSKYSFQPTANMIRNVQSTSAAMPDSKLPFHNRQQNRKQQQPLSPNKQSHHSNNARQQAIVTSLSEDLEMQPRSSNSWMSTCNVCY